VFFPCSFNLSDDDAYHEMYEKTPTEFRRDLLVEVFGLEDLFKTKLTVVWPHFKKLLDKETVFGRIKEGWPEGHATLCHKVDEQWETPRPNEAQLARLCQTLKLPLTDRNLYHTALQQYPGNASAELAALQKALRDEALEEEEEAEEEEEEA
jgi:hypothetical protein